ncbi:fidgetin like 2 [Willisornis vidua]|uniref:Fidgetin like 2 n=1 Tax=Willisornis vidua TaxID=1566151 RepID=A0ABQ9DVV5_9PASS|nr:fidgetin like 2 [Willisornis vidua]
MHWSPEHAQSLNQWPEQHLDVSSTTSSPAHKSDLYPSTRQRFNYAWANDDISALTASNLLKRYAEKYSGVLDAPYERPALGGYGDGAFGASAGLAPLAVPPLGTEAGALKRKAFDIGGDDDGEGRYRKYSYEQPKSPYPMSDNGECRGNGFGGTAESPQVAFKPGKRLAGAGNAEEHAGKYGGQQMKSMVSPPYDASLRSAEPFEKFSPPLANGDRPTEPGPPFPLRLPPKAPVFGGAVVEEQPKNVDPLVLELVNTKVVERGPPVQWSDVAGQVSVKAAIEEELVWPILRPGAYSGATHPLRTLLLFGPRGTGKTLLSRCISTQLGSTLLRLSATTLLSTWKAEAEKILQTVFFVASCRQPAVVLITEAEALLAARAGEDGSQVSNLKAQLLSYLDNVATSSEQNVVVIGTTARPGSMDEASHRRFGTRLYIPLPDGAARRHILRQALAQQSCCLSERELAALAQRTETFSGAELLRLCQHAGAARRALPGAPTSYQDLEKAFCKVRPAASQKELDLFLEWDKMYGTRH